MLVTPCDFTSRNGERAFYQHGNLHKTLIDHLGNIHNTQIIKRIRNVINLNDIFFLSHDKLYERK